MKSWHLRKRRSRWKRGGGTLNLVSLMDIFTILVFFLMVNADRTELITPPSGLELPPSTAETPPEETILLVVDAEGVRSQGRLIVRSAALEAGRDEALRTWLAGIAAPPEDAAAGTGPDGEAPAPIVTILGDKGIPYTLLRGVMKVCQQSGVSTIRLAVDRQEQAS